MAPTRPTQSADSSSKEGAFKSASIHAWIAEHILPHETAVRRWLRRARVSRCDEDDVVQEAYCRLSGVSHFNDIDSSRAYLFVTVRNILRERLRRDRFLSVWRLGEIDGFSALNAVPSSESCVSDHQMLSLVGRMIEELPERCRTVLIARRIEGLSQSETARRLKLTQNVVGKEVAHGLRIIAQRLAEHDLAPPGTLEWVRVHAAARPLVDGSASCR